MKEAIEIRLENLQAEYKKGQEQIAALQQETANVSNAMLRISGAIQVLQELLKAEENDFKKVTKDQNGQVKKAAI